MSSTVAGLLQVGVLLVALAVVYRPLGDHMARVFTSTKHLAVERAVYRIGSVNPDSEQRWPLYAAGVQSPRRCAATGKTSISPRPTGACWSS